MKRIFNLSIASALTLSSLCAYPGIASTPSVISDYTADTSSLPTVRWSLLPPLDNEGKCVQRFIFNHTDSIQSICFTQLPRPMKLISPIYTLKEINAGYYSLSSPLFESGEKDIIIDIECVWPLRSVSECPESFHAITKNGKIIPVKIHDRMSLIDATLKDNEWINWTIKPDSIYRLNDRLLSGQAPGVFDLVPSFKKVIPAEGIHRSGLPIETKIIANPNSEYYKITLTPTKALIEGASDKGVAMGLRMYRRRLMRKGVQSLPCAIIEDWPDSPYRGLMIDIARNYQTPATLKHIADLMADFRFNTLHFHITDDEGWRLEIPGLPELTEIGARRGYTTDSHEFLPEIFAGTGDVNRNLDSASGFFTREDFIDFITYCDSIGIKVIPEIESPGHARAAIKAMEARYRNSGDDTYRLIETTDSSNYTTAQFYHDNLMNPALPGTYRFIEKVVDEIAAMYDEAQVELPGIHLGGDEVPEGAWDGSPAVKVMCEKLGIDGRHAIQGEYVRKIAEIMRSRNIPLYGWQDICIGYDEDFHKEVTPAIGGMDCWVSAQEVDKNVAVQGVRNGYPVILSNVDYFYMDMLYSPHPEEKGLFWGGFTDEFRTLAGYPDLICPRDGSEKGRVIGVSGKLFAETIRSRKDLERLLFPKCLGLAERGWNNSSTYSPDNFNILLAEKELPYLSEKNVTWHLRQPGILIENNKILMNSPYPDAKIFYTLDGTRPSLIGSSVYENPVDLPEGEVIIQAILCKDGIVSVPTFIKIATN